MNKQHVYLIGLFFLVIPTIQADPVSPEGKSPEAKIQRSPQVDKYADDEQLAPSFLGTDFGTELVEPNIKINSSQAISSSSQQSVEPAALTTHARPTEREMRKMRALLAAEEDPQYYEQANLGQDRTETPYNDAKHTLLFLYAKNGDCDGIQELCGQANGRLNVNIKTGSGLRPLYFAVKSRHTEAVRLLCSLGAHINKHVGFNWNYLQIAVHHNDFATAQALLEAGIEKDGQTGVLANTALHLATAINCKCPKHCDYKMVELLLSHGVVDLPDIFGQTAIFHAIKQGKLDIAMLLAQNEGALSHRDENGQSPLQFAQSHKYYVGYELSDLASDNDRAIIQPKVVESKPLKRTGSKPSRKKVSFKL